MDTSLAALISLNQFSTGRRLFAFYRVREAAQKAQEADIEALAQEAIQADEASYSLELRWATKRRTGKPSAKQIKDQKALQKIDGSVDKALSGLRDSAVALIEGADDDEKELVADVEKFLHEILPNGVQVVTSKPYSEQSVAVKAIVGRLSGDLEPLVTKLGLSVNAKRLAKLSTQYEDALKAVDTLDFGDVKAARQNGQAFLLRLAAKIMGTFDEPTGDDAQKRAALLGPIVKQNEAISQHIRSRRSVPDVDPKTGEEQTPDAISVGDAEPDAAPALPAPTG